MRSDYYGPRTVTVTIHLYAGQVYALTENGVSIIGTTITSEH